MSITTDTVAAWVVGVIHCASGYHDATGQPRTEPLYDMHGRPIAPRLPASAFRKRQEYEEASRDWLERSEKALKEWGRWGKGRNRES